MGLLWPSIVNINYLSIYLSSGDQINKGYWNNFWVISFLKHIILHSLCNNEAFLFKYINPSFFIIHNESLDTWVCLRHLLHLSVQHSEMINVILTAETAGSNIERSLYCTYKSDCMTHQQLLFATAAYELL